MHQSHSSRSLFNTTQSPGWTPQETQILKLALMKFGIGQWTAIVRSGILPGKAITQITVMTQRVLGQQSLGGLVGLHVDVDAVRAYNEERVQRSLRDDATEEVLVKNGMIVNRGNNPTKASKLREFNFNKERFDLSDQEVADRVDEFQLFALKRQRRIMFNNMVRRVLAARGVNVEEAEREVAIHGNRTLVEIGDMSGSGTTTHTTTTASSSLSQQEKEEKILKMKESLERNRKRLRDLEEELLQIRKQKRRRTEGDVASTVDSHVNNGGEIVLSEEGEGCDRQHLHTHI